MANDNSGLLKSRLNFAILVAREYGRLQRVKTRVLGVKVFDETNAYPSKTYVITLPSSPFRSKIRVFVFAMCRQIHGDPEQARSRGTMDPEDVWDEFDDLIVF